MPAALVRTHTSGNSIVSGTTVTFTVASPGVDAGNIVFCLVVFDNTGVTSPSSGLSVPAGETAGWVNLGIAFDAAPGTSGGSVRGELRAIQPRQAWPAGTVITVTLTAAVVAKVAMAAEFSGIGVSALRSNSGTGANAAAVSAAATTGTAPQAGDLVIGGIGMESNVAPTADADTLNGSWDAGVTSIANVGVAATSAAGRLQWKIPTAAGQQTLNKSDAVNGGCCVGCLPFATVKPAGKRNNTAVARAAGF